MAERRSEIYFGVSVEGEEIFYIVKVILEVSSTITIHKTQSSCITVTKKKGVGSFLGCF